MSASVRELHKVTAHLVETAVVMLFPELLERFKARVAAVVEGIDAIAGTFGHGQRLLQTDDLNRGHDFIKAGVVRLTRVERKCLNIINGDGNFLVRPSSVRSSGGASSPSVGGANTLS